MIGVLTGAHCIGICRLLVVINGLGTCVLMIFFGLFGKFIPKGYNKYITRVSTVLIVTLGLLLMTKDLSCCENTHTELRVHKNT